MRITFFSNFLNHHQTPFCDEMYGKLGNDFTFVSTEDIPNSFLNSGYPDCRNYVYNLLSYLGKSQFEKAIALSKESDIVIIGSAPEIFVKERLKLNKLTFRYFERLLKKGDWMLFDPRVLRALLKYHTKYRNRNLYMLCASAYTARDLMLVGAYPDKMFKWGYFTEVEELDIDQLISNKPQSCIQLLWVARFIDWKHPELAIKLAHQLMLKGYNFHLKMIGTGERIDSCKKLIKELNLTDYISLLGTMPNNEVKTYMHKSNIFLFTSDRNEGWGAVLNEAMSAGCAVASSDAIGSAPFLIENNINGILFKSKDLPQLCAATEKLVMDASLREKLSRNAYLTMKNLWNPQKAATNFLSLGSAILNGEKIDFQEGPCSKA